MKLVTRHIYTHYMERDSKLRRSYHESMKKLKAKLDLQNDEVTVKWQAPGGSRWLSEAIRGLQGGGSCVLLTYIELIVPREKARVPRSFTRRGLSTHDSILLVFNYNACY
ncbi:unnamed protein product [Colias eurytheme]|nr:unnamed protein product [Colias eurytheme]